jgi:hypothetical protein
MRGIDDLSVGDDREKSREVPVWPERAAAEIVEIPDDDH